MALNIHCSNPKNVSFSLFPTEFFPLMFNYMNCRAQRMTQRKKNSKNVKHVYISVQLALVSSVNKKDTFITVLLT